MYADVLRDLTGAPTYNYQIDGTKNLYQLVKEAIKNRWIVTCTTNPEMKRMLENKGLHEDHAYSLLSTATVEDKQGNLKNLIKLRDPYSETNWNGDWNIDSK